MPEATLQYLKSDDLKTQLQNTSVNGYGRTNHGKNVCEAAVKLLDSYHADLNALKGDVKKSLDKDGDKKIDIYQTLATQLSSEIKFASEFDFRDDVINSVRTRILAANKKVVDTYDVAASYAALNAVIDPQKSNAITYADGVYTFTAAANQPKITDVIKSTKLANAKSLELDYTHCTSENLKKQMASLGNNGKVRISEGEDAKGNLTYVVVKSDGTRTDQRAYLREGVTMTDRNFEALKSSPSDIIAKVGRPTGFKEKLGPQNAKELQQLLYSEISGLVATCQSEGLHAKDADAVFSKNRSGTSYLEFQGEERDGTNTNRNILSSANMSNTLNDKLHIQGINILHTSQDDLLKYANTIFHTLWGQRTMPNLNSTIVKKEGERTVETSKQQTVVGMLSDYKEYLSGLARSESGDNRTTISAHIAYTLEPIIHTLQNTPQTKLQVYDLIEQAILTEDGPSGVITRNPVTRRTQLQALKNIKTAIKSLNTINFVKEMRILGYNDTDMSNHTSHVVAHSEVVDQVKTNDEAANNIITAIKAKCNDSKFCQSLVDVTTVQDLKTLLDTSGIDSKFTQEGNIDIGSSGLSFIGGDHINITRSDVGKIFDAIQSIKDQIPKKDKILSDMTSERARLMQSDVKNLTDVDSSRLQVLDFYLDPANINKKEVTDMIDKTIAETRSAIVGFAFQDITTHLLLDKHDAADDVISQAYKDVKGVGLFTFSDGSYNMAAELTKQLPRFALDMVIISGLEFFTFGGGTPAVAAYASTKYARLFGKVGTEFIETFRRSAKLRKFVAAGKETKLALEAAKVAKNAVKVGEAVKTVSSTVKAVNVVGKAAYMGTGLTLWHGLKDDNLLDKSLKEILKDTTINSLMMGVGGKFTFINNKLVRMPLIAKTAMRIGAEATTLTAGTAAINAGFGAEGDPTQDMIANVAFMLLMEVLHIAVPKAKELIFPKIKEAIQATPPEQLKKDLDILTNNLTPEQITDLGETAIEILPKKLEATTLKPPSNTIKPLTAAEKSQNKFISTIDAINAGKKLSKQKIAHLQTIIKGVTVNGFFGPETQAKLLEYLEQNPEIKAKLKKAGLVGVEAVAETTSKIIAKEATTSAESVVEAKVEEPVVEATTSEIKPTEPLIEGKSSETKTSETPETDLGKPEEITTKKQISEKVTNIANRVKEKINSKTWNVEQAQTYLSQLSDWFKSLPEKLKSNDIIKKIQTIIKDVVEFIMGKKIQSAQENSTLPKNFDALSVEAKNDVHLANIMKNNISGYQKYSNRFGDTLLGDLGVGALATLFPAVGSIPGYSINLINTFVSSYYGHKIGISGKFHMNNITRQFKDSLVGMVPGIGFFWDVAFKANKRNTTDMITHYEQHIQKLKNNGSDPSFIKLHEDQIVLLKHNQKNFLKRNLTRPKYEKAPTTTQAPNTTQAPTAPETSTTPNTIPDLLSNPTFQSDLFSLSSLADQQLQDRMQQLASVYSIDVKDIEAYMKNAHKSAPTTSRVTPPPVGASIN